MFANYRDCQAWKDAEMPLYTASNEACKMYDAIQRQMTVKREDESIGGIEGSVEKMFKADPNFVMAHVIKEYMSVSVKPKNDPDVLKSIQNVVDLANSQWDHLSVMEKGHCKALQCMGKGHYKHACTEWENILIEHPKDMQALRSLYMTRLGLSEFEEQRDAVARVLPFYNRKNDIEYGYLVGMHAFGLQETQMYDQSEIEAKEALDCDRHDAWATHTLAHVYEMTGRYNEGIDFMTRTKSDWEIITGLSCHNHWHRTLYHIEKNDIEGALRIYDEELAPRLANPTSDMFSVSDCVSMLYRLRLEGIDVGKERWKTISEKLEKYVDLHSFGYYDGCIMMGFSGAELLDQQNKFIESIKDLAANEDGSDPWRVANLISVYLCEAIQLYEQGEYDKAVEVLSPHRYNVAALGGSRAQRDVFSLLLIHAATKSQSHQKLAVQLLNERKALKCTPLTERLMSNIVVEHDC